MFIYHLNYFYFLCFNVMDLLYVIKNVFVILMIIFYDIYEHYLNVIDLNVYLLSYLFDKVDNNILLEFVDLIFAFLLIKFISLM